MLLQKRVTYFNIFLPNTHLLVSRLLKIRSNSFLIAKNITYIRILGVGMPQEGVTYFNIFLPNTYHPS